VAFGHLKTNVVPLDDGKNPGNNEERNWTRILSFFLIGAGKIFFLL
jgi:hypothetical protein